MTKNDPLQTLWKSGNDLPQTVSITDIRNRSRHFQSGIRRRNFYEYATAILVIGLFSITLVNANSLIMKAGATLIILACVFVCFKFYTLGKPISQEQQQLAVNMIEFHRAELQRQRNALADVWKWYLAPFVPGILLHVIGSRFANGDAQLSTRIIVTTICLLGIGVVFIFIHWLNMRAAGKLDNEITELDQLRQSNSSHSPYQ